MLDQQQVTTEVEVETHPLVVRMRPVIDLTDDQFFEFCQINRDLRIERTAEGELLIMPPTGSSTGNQNAKLLVQLGVWAERDGTGVYFDSSTGFKLSPGAPPVSPDASWIKLERWNALAPEQQEKFAPISPDFVVELRSKSDGLKPLQSKMQDYIDKGVKLGWLLDRQNRRVYIYRPGVPVQELDNPETVSGAPELPGFILKLGQIW
ncbi:Uma2 family endonuclease [Coleofasciculus sp. FACHB-712]|uniref:Uma2 family endonuclease n=1 Tax=Coleofasciculus sp. FACHB-712 TaxID=2692789 RepID=UPI0016848300|nr:Uma2 family endonuclease [Coleofasciculus sp. FACHB-712]MBD1942501.1 Uma2 family endonuclease [Coleofasciculus sp. FACHB-712]